MTEAEARAAVDAKLVEPLRKPVTVTFEGVKLPTQPRAARGLRGRRRDGRAGSGGEPERRPARSRVALCDRRGGRRRDLAADHLLGQGARASSSTKVSAEVDRAPGGRLDRALARLAEPGRGLRRGRGRRRRAALAPGVGGPEPRRPPRDAPGRAGQARGDDRGARGPVPDLPDGRPLELRAHACGAT